MKHIIWCLALLWGSRALPGFAQADTSSIFKGDGACSHCQCSQGNTSPLGVMTDHIHRQGEWMLSYTYMDMAMQGNQTGNQPASDVAVAAQYMMVPTTMHMRMHMLMAMYGVTDRLTVMAMAGYNSNTMGMTMPAMQMAGMTMAASYMQCSSRGLADTRLYGLYQLSLSDKHSLVTSLGVNVPTGSIRATGTTMLGDRERLPYNMQLGTGTVAVLPGITYTYAHGDWSFGVDVGGDIKLGYNTLGYRWGNSYHATAWAAYQLLPFLSISVRPEATVAGKITGTDPAMLNEYYAAYDLTTLTSNYGGHRVNVYTGLNLHLNRRVFEKFTALVEYGVPCYQNLNGTQMSNKSNLLVGLQYGL